MGLNSALESSLLGIAVTNGYLLSFVPGSQIAIFFRVYYYFYERSLDIVLKSRAGIKSLSTPESMLIGLIAG